MKLFKVLKNALSRYALLDTKAFRATKNSPQLLSMDLSFCSCQSITRAYYQSCHEKVFEPRPHLSHPRDL
jgi:hypothetical protein